MERWKKIALTEEQLQIIYREWGIFYTHKQKLDIAANYYDISLNIKNDPKALYNRSRCKRNIAQTEGSLRDARAAVESDPMSQALNLEICDGLYELNEFEKAKCEIFNCSLKFTGHKLRAFRNRNDVLDDNFNDTLGDTLGPHILQNEKYFHKALEKIIRERNIDKRPLWKVLKKQGHCDVLSILEKEEELISPREIARQKLAFNVFNQIYMRRSWVDLLFMKTLKSHPTLILPQSKWSSPQLEEITHNKYEVAMRFLKMLNARAPLYTKNVRKFTNKVLHKKSKEEHLFRVQYQVHRNMLAILRNIKNLRKLKKIEKLTRYIEEVMGDYVVLKARRVMPWKFEFINEVYNILALTYIDNYLSTPQNLTDIKPEERLTWLLKLPKDRDKEPIVFVFGYKPTHRNEDSADQPMIGHKKFLARMEKRIAYSEYCIEICYLLHEIAKSQLINSRFDECCIIARKSIVEATKCNSLVWNLLGLLLICKSHAVLHKIEKIHDTLNEAKGIAQRLKNDEVIRYIDLLDYINDEYTMEKKLQEEFRKTKSRHSMSSSGYKNSSIF
ncbi:uncharacterized protein LOC129940732 isoform X1 [Eupeodes corollae]|uniref:uncharacterized protein LOC129940732 isoform X1 n=1 Tax=Eupeodes corollae TaxID=290404 RepID=UPI00249120FF|nr:uncharacterized protein LOC129940732 isoform X1 [Eupeodes corollae]